MPTFDFTSPDGKKYSIEGPEGATKEQAFQILQTQIGGAKKPAPSFGQMFKDEMLTSLPGGVARGVKDVIDTGAEYLSRLGGSGESERIKAGNDAGKAEFKQAQENVGAGGSDVARVGGNIVATLPVGGVLAAPAKALGLTRVGNALASGGMTTGAKVAPNMLARAGDMGLRMAGGGATGYVGAGLVDPDSANMGGAIGAALPPVAKLAGAGGNLVGSLVKPFFSKGQDQIAGNTLRQFASNADEAMHNLRNAPEMVPGSLPTAAAAAGDEGLSGLSRTLQSADPRYAAELAARGYAQNAARTAALEEVAGNTGKIALAKEARDTATGAMRETVLDAAGQLPARTVLDGIDRLLSNPNNAGKLSQQALSEYRARIAQFAPDGQIDARALYAIRKDINDTLGGKLQGEAGNLRHAAGQLKDVKGLIDDAIDLASRRVTESAGRAVVPYNGRLGQAGAGVGEQAARPSWRGYLQKYADESIPINQMEELEKVLKGISTNTVDKEGSAILSAAKLNGYLRNNAKDLEKTLSPGQLDLLRRVSADLNAAQTAGTAGKALGSNTVQNLSGVNALTSLMGKTMGGSSPMQSTLGRSVNWLYKRPDEEIMRKLSQAMLDPQEAARLLQTPEGNRLLKLLAPAGQLGYKAAPAISAQ